MYDDVVAAPSSEPHERNENENGSMPSNERSDGNDVNGGYSQMGNSFPPNHPGRRHQLYIGNLTWVRYITIQLTSAENCLLLKHFACIFNRCFSFSK